MIATTAKPSGPSGLRTLLEAADSGNPIELGEDMAWKLARLVLTLTEALGTIAAHPVYTPVMGRSDLGIDPMPACQDTAKAALDAVEKLEL